MDTLSLYSGAGGLDYGLEAAGFNTVACVEIDQDARDTLKLNRPLWHLSESGDIFSYKPENLLSESNIKRKSLALLCGGPPCQPFSKAGLWAASGARRLEDPRSKTLTAYLDILEASLPEVFLVENVKGFDVSGQSDALHLFTDRLRAINKRNNTKYSFSFISINAADFGIPQFRERVFLIGHRDGKSIVPPIPTHANPQLANHLQKPWMTSWDAIGHLSGKLAPKNLNLNLKGKWAELIPSIPEGENYLWHTPKGGGEPLFGWRTRYWNFLLKLAKNKPSWTLQASPGPATGPFHWENRLLSIEEIARLQTFPDEIQICGQYNSARKQLGNAVPSALAELMGLEIRRQIFGEKVRRHLKLIPDMRMDCPRKSPVRRVPSKYFSMRADHASHPGTGLGPQPRLLTFV